MKIISLSLTLLLAALVAATSAFAATTEFKVYSVAEGDYIMTKKVEKSAEQWRALLSAEQFHVLREKGTERAFTGKYDKHYVQGSYRCAGCGLDLFTAKDKYDSESGWPSFTAPVAAENIAAEDDSSFFVSRTEILCARCGGHLGHVFNDGPKPTGLRYCINSASLEFVAGE